ncbi:carbohydrate ABC transporter permease [Stackebrandtia nassauensis]|uniref:Binding-protein-dependent transport systems inner membrane component n=1 Tax=Stackebrandtia nassauensis (strain DSM 44728 / CIP 108903 / NRRL B-16338 / NBRC 102104 / LLR-40K-21) TaxID=446470 RepID=D3Q1P4_STANL|nr:sugar ABC transporter permease [Stackebrandtia nassauensis]ADD39892.1 binding-protein-dependent transport systems inner membrane component [Stackebrandtia nassauensis DSM 44728]
MAATQVTEVAPRRRRIPPVVWLIAPSVLFMAALMGWPTISGLIQAFKTGDGFGFDNFARMAADPFFWPAVRNTLLLIVILIPVQFALALGMALLLRAKPKLSGLYFYIWAIPLAVSDLAAGLVWLSIFTDHGYLNSFLSHLGIDGVNWLSYDSNTSMFFAVFIAELWRATSLVLVIVVAGMQGIPKDYDEAAQVFGASYWQRLRHVTLPLLRPSLQVALILRTILAFQTFAVAQALTGRDFPVLVGETYNWYVALRNPSVASALALVILAISMITAIVYLRALRDPSDKGGKR